MIACDSLAAVWISDVHSDSSELSFWLRSKLLSIVFFTQSPQRFTPSRKAGHYVALNLESLACSNGMLKKALEIGAIMRLIIEVNVVGM